MGSGVASALANLLVLLIAAGDFGKEPHCRLTLLLFHIGFMPVDVVFRYSRLVVSATGNRAAAASIL